MRSSRVSRSVRLEDAIEIWRRRNQGEAQHVIAANLNINQGRVSEVLTGKRFPEAKGLSS